jgi:hypothetical protein
MRELWKRIVNYNETVDRTGAPVCPGKSGADPLRRPENPWMNSFGESIRTRTQPCQNTWLEAKETFPVRQVLNAGMANNADRRPMMLQHCNTAELQHQCLSSEERVFQGSKVRKRWKQ